MAVCACCGKEGMGIFMARIWKDHAYVCQSCVSKAGGYGEAPLSQGVEAIKEAIRTREEQKNAVAKMLLDNAIKQAQRKREETEEIAKKENDKYTCPQCGEEMGMTDKFCKNCGYKVDDQELERRKEQKEQLKDEKELEALEDIFVGQMLGRACPKCGCTDLQYNKSAFSVGKAAIGLAVAGPIGLLAGATGDNKTYAVCKNCGHAFLLMYNFVFYQC